MIVDQLGCSSFNYLNFKRPSETKSYFKRACLTKKALKKIKKITLCINFKNIS